MFQRQSKVACFAWRIYGWYILNRGENPALGVPSNNDGEGRRAHGGEVGWVLAHAIIVNLVVDIWRKRYYGRTLIRDENVKNVGLADYANK